MSRPIHLWRACLCALLLASGTAGANDRNDFRVRYGEEFLRTISLSPRATGLGGTYAAINDGANSTFQNPAALGAMTGKEVVTNLGIDAVREGGQAATFVTCTVGGAFNLNTSPQYHPVDQMGNHTIGIVYQRGDGWVDDADGLGRESNALILGYGTSLMMGRVLVGGALSYENADISDNGGLDIDFYRLGIRGGVILRLSEALNVGAVAAYAGGPGQQNTGQGNVESDVEHFEIRGGVSYQYSESLLLAGDMAFESLKQGQDGGAKREEEHSIFRISSGVEYAVMPRELTLRGGLFYQQDDWDAKYIAGYGDSFETAVGLALGASLYRNNWSLEYNAQIETTGDHSHHMSFILDF